MSIRIKRHLQAQYPELSGLLAQLSTIPKLRKRDLPLPEAVVRVVTGQMLSAKAAHTIYERIKAKAAELQLAGSWLLDYDTLRACGLSGAKARTVCDLGSRIGPEHTALDHWHTLPAAELVSQIKAYRGMGDWTAAIIALFYIGHEDIFPAGDGSLKKAIAIIQAGTRGRRRIPLDPDKATPYRSYLALYLWRALDAGILTQPGNNGVTPGRSTR